MTFTRAGGSRRRSARQLAWRSRLWCSSGEAQVDEQAGQVVVQAGHRSWEAPGEGGRELGGPSPRPPPPTPGRAARRWDRSRTSSRISLRAGARRAPWPEGFGPGGWHTVGADCEGRPPRLRRSARGAVGDDLNSGGAFQADHAVQELFQASVDPDAGSRPTSTGRPSAVMPQAASTGSARRAFMHAEVGSVQEQVLQRDVRQIPIFQASKSTLMASQTRLTVDLDRAASAPAASARLHVTHRQTPHEPGDGSPRRWCGTPRHLTAGRANASSVPRSLGRSIVTAPEVVLMVVGQCPLRLPGRTRSPWA